MLLFLLISMVSYSQTELYVSIGGASYKKMSAMHITGVVDTIFVDNTSTILTFSISSSNGDQFTMKKPANITVGTFTVGVKDTVKITAAPQYYFIGWTSVSSYYFKFLVKYKPLVINHTVSNNTVQFNVDTLHRLNYTINSTIVHGTWEYKFDQSINTPVVGTSTISMQPNIPTQNYSTSGVYYLHVRTWNINDNPNENQFGYSISSWNTYSVNLTYVPTVTTSISEVDKVTDFKLYPNPAKDVITVEYSSKNNIDHVSLYTITGQEVSTTAVESMGNNTLTFNVESYPAGIYFVRIGTTSYKFIKQ